MFNLFLVFAVCSMLALVLCPPGSLPVFFARPMRAQRFGLAGVLMAVFCLSVLSACSSSPTGTTAVVNVSLGAVQSEARAIDGAVDTLAPSLEASMPAANAAKARLAVTALDAAATATEGLTAGESTTAALEAFDGAAHGVVAVLPLPATTGVAIEAGLVIFDALLAGLPTATVPASAAPSVASAILGAPPVAIPLQ